MAGKDNASASEIDKTSYFWAGKCGACHPGGGPTEFDRDGEKYYDLATNTFGYENLGKTADDVLFDGDYSFVSPSTGSHMAAKWDVTGVSEPDCLSCHKNSWTISDGKIMNGIWRMATLRSMHTLVDDAAATIPAYYSAPTASMGWFSSIVMKDLPTGKPTEAESLQIDYQVGLDSGTLEINADGFLALAGNEIAQTPPDYACWQCHTFADSKKRGRSWFNADQDVHFAAFAHRLDGNPETDIADADSRGCLECHPGNGEHDFAKGNASLQSVRNQTDYSSFRTCRECHMESDLKHELASLPSSPIHVTGGHMDVMSCEFCHIPYKETKSMMALDNATTGTSMAFWSDDSGIAMASGNPLDPGDAIKDRWYPSVKWKTDSDGVDRIFTMKSLSTIYWANWEQNGTPDDFTDDVVSPIILWRVRQITSNAALPSVVDDNGDGKFEVNTLDEISEYITALKGVDNFGNVVAANPVLIKGGKVYYEDLAEPSGVGHFEHHGSGINVESLVPFSVDHNVQPAYKALGAGGSCGTCHRGLNGGLLAPGFDRLIVEDPYGEDGQPVYTTPRELIAINPF